jgi:hypothetical protein
MLMNNRQGDFISASHTLYPSPPHRKKIIELAALVAESMVAKMDGEITTDHIVPVVLSHNAFLMVKRIANDHRHGGKKVGVARFLKALIVQDLRRRGCKLQPSDFE